MGSCIRKRQVEFMRSTVKNSLSMKEIVAEVYSNSGTIKVDKRYLNHEDIKNYPKEGRCVYRLHRGARKGQYCGRKVIPGTVFCELCT